MLDVDGGALYACGAVGRAAGRGGATTGTCTGVYVYPYPYEAAGVGAVIGVEATTGVIGVAAGVGTGATTTVPGGTFEPHALQLDAVFLFTHSHFEQTHNSGGTSGAEAAATDG